MSVKNLSEQPVISVLMSVYNNEKYLSEAVNSILNQTFADFEFIIINDGSTDDSESILREFEKQDYRIQLFSRANTGLIGALNEGLGYAKGRYVARMDSDDISLPDRFAKQVAFLDNHLDYVAVGTRTLVIDPEGRAVKVANTLTSHEEIDSANIAGYYGQLSHPTVMFRRQAVEKLGAYREEMIYAEDADLFFRFAEVGKIANLPNILLKYRLHLKSIGHSQSAKQRESAYLALTEACHRRGLEPPKRPSFAQEKLNSLSDTYCRWAWWALMDGNVATARRNAFLAVSIEPTSKDAWKTLFCAIRGR